MRNLLRYMLIALLAYTAHGAVAADDRELLAAVGARPAAGLLVAYELQDVPQDQLRRIEIAVAANGDFHEKQFFKTAENPVAWQSKPMHYVHYSSDMLTASLPGMAAEYTQQPVPNYKDAVPGPVQWGLCPWPVAARLCQWLLDAPDLEIVDFGKSIRASSVRSMLALEADRNGRLLAVTRGDLTIQDTITFRFEYDDANLGAPARMSQIISAMPARSRQERRFNWKATSCAELAASPASVKFDPVELGASKYDPESGDVIHPIRGLLYNRNEVERQAVEASWQHKARPWAFGGLGIVVVAAALYGYRKIRQG